MAPAQPLKLGIIGISEGNGHPYSWAAICNGYEPQAMSECPFPVIPAYLARQRFPEDAVRGARVTHVWTQSRERSEHIARASKIEHVVADYHDLLDQVDGVLLARDDYENHFRFSAPFLEAGMPIYIDKPLATSVRDAEMLFARSQFDGQIFSCSALRYAPELQLGTADRAACGPLVYIEASAPKYWATYSPHIIEPMLALIMEEGDVEDYRVERSADRTVLVVRWPSGLIATFATLGRGQTPIRFHIVGEQAARELRFSNPFQAFRGALDAFVDGIVHRSEAIRKCETMRVISIIERGMNG